MTMLEVLFFAVAVVQVVALSVYLPNRVNGWVTTILDRYPPETHPKLYPLVAGIDPVKATKRWLTGYRITNGVVALIGVGMIVAGVVSGYELGPKGGAEKWVILYFFLQMIPHAVSELTTMGVLKLMRRAAPSGIRRATLAPRRLADYISPTAVMTAIVLYATWMILYLYFQGNEPWDTKVYITLGTITAGHLFFWFMIYQALFGKRLDPHQAESDRARRMAGAAKIAVTSSILVSAFLIITEVVREYSLDRLEPVITSLYLMATASIPFRFACGGAPLDKTDFSVYQDVEPPISSPSESPAS